MPPTFPQVTKQEYQRHSFPQAKAYGKALNALSAEAESLEGFTQFFHRLKPMEKPCKTARFNLEALKSNQEPNYQLKIKQ